MKVTEIFKLISKKMMVDFQISAQFKHNGLRGDRREEVLKEFLSGGKLPKQYSIGNGEIISSYTQTSKQTDLIIYDTNKSIKFEASDSLQIFPIESIYGVIEVKSKLSKSKLIEALDNIKSIKEIYTQTHISKLIGNSTLFSYQTNSPFGVIFAYDLGGNSLDSLRLNLIEWCEKNSPQVWPNSICILNSGIIKFVNGLNDALHSNDINKNCQITAIHYKEESLFEFTSSLISLCTGREIDIFDLKNYKNLGFIVDGLRVKGAAGFKDPENGNELKLSNDFIKEIFEVCKDTMEYKDLILLTTGSESMVDQHFSDRSDLIYLYNPLNYPGMIELTQNNTGDLISLLRETPNIVTGHNIYINDFPYYIPYTYIDKNKTQPL